MRVSSILLATVALILLISVLCIWFYPSIQDFMAGNTMWNGIKTFCDEFDADNIDSLDELPIPPENTTLVAIPYLEYSDTELSKIKRFVVDGGTLLLMDDYGYGNSILTYLGLSVRFSNRPLLDPLFCYKNQWMPRITDFASEMNERELTVIIFNHATSLNVIEDTRVIAWSSKASFLDTDEKKQRRLVHIPMGRFGEASEMAKAALFLASDESSYMTGSSFTVDGGIVSAYVTPE